MQATALSDIAPFRHGWLFFVAATFANAAIWWYRGRQKMAENPALVSGYRRLIWGLLVYGNIPWLVLGVGFELPYLLPTLLITFFVVVIILWIGASYWIFFGGGSKDLAMHPGILRGNPQEPGEIEEQF